MTQSGNASDRPRYPRTPYWPTSPSLEGAGGRDRALIAEPDRFVGSPVVITEKLDGSSTLLHRGVVFGRSVMAPSTDGWMAMVKKHHAWKLMDSEMFLYGEDIYGVHSIEYGPVPEDKTFYAFALRDGEQFQSFRVLAEFADTRAIPLVPVLHEGVFWSTGAARLRSPKRFH